MKRQRTETKEQKRTTVSVLIHKVPVVDKLPLFFDDQEPPDWLPIPEINEKPHKSFVVLKPKQSDFRQWKNEEQSHDVCETDLSSRWNFDWLRFEANQALKQLELDKEWSANFWGDGRDNNFGPEETKEQKDNMFAPEIDDFVQVLIINDKTVEHEEAESLEELDHLMPHVIAIPVARIGEARSVLSDDEKE